MALGTYFGQTEDIKADWSFRCMQEKCWEIAPVNRVGGTLETLKTLEPPNKEQKEGMTRT